MKIITKFYDDISQYYHLIYADWEKSIENQSQSINAIIQDTWGKETKTILDASCGIGTQSLGLANLGYTITASDISPKAIERAKKEAEKKKLTIHFSVADMRQLSSHHKEQYDITICCDNSLPHIQTDTEIKKVLQEFYKCTKPKGGCLVTVRDYAKEKLEGTQIKTYGIRHDGSNRFFVFQVWEFDKNEHYDVSLYFVKDNGESNCETLVFRSKYYAITIEKIMKFMSEVGFADVKIVDNTGFFQPVIIGNKQA